MSFLMVIFVVLMCLWLFGGCYISWNPTSPGVAIGGTIIPWACVAIIGYVLFGGGR